MARWLTEFLAHLWVRLSRLLVMPQAVLLDCSSLDALGLQLDGLATCKEGSRLHGKGQAITPA